METICHNCDGKGIVKYKVINRKPTSCLYCGGLGTRKKLVYSPKDLK